MFLPICLPRCQRTIELLSLATIKCPQVIFTMIHMSSDLTCNSHLVVYFELYLPLSFCQLSLLLKSTQILALSIALSIFLCAIFSFHTVVLVNDMFQHRYSFYVFFINNKGTMLLKISPNLQYTIHVRLNSSYFSCFMDPIKSNPVV